jgi:hypothetical protein
VKALGSLTRPRGGEESPRFFGCTSLSSSRQPTSGATPFFARARGGQPTRNRPLFVCERQAGRARLIGSRC